MVGLTNKQLEDLGKKKLGNSFLGVFPSDSSPNVKNINNSSIIFNLSKHTESGTHYVAVLFRNSKIYYFDSYGKSLTNYYIKKYLKFYNVPIFYHTRSIQHKNSIFCSLYALAYLTAMQKKNIKPSTFYAMFNNPPNKKNDKIVTNFLLSNK
jgi:hypothetical protein